MESADSSSVFRKIRARTIGAAVGLALAALPASAAGDWPVYGHDLANTRNAGQAGPSVAALRQAWRFDSPTGDFTGTPVVAGGVLVAGDNSGSVYALNAASGRLLWSKKLGQPVNGSAAIDVHAPGGAAVYLPVAQPGRPQLVALSLRSGAKLWDTALTTQPDSSVFGSPVFWRGSAYIGTSGPNNDNTHARGSLVAVNQATGKVRWQTFTVPPGRDGAAVWSTPAIDTGTGRLYVGTGNNYHEPTTDLEDSILAVDAHSGRILAHYQATSGDSFSLPGNPVGPDADFGASPNLFTAPSGRRLLGAGQKSGTYWALDRSTMRPVWHTNIGPGSDLGGILGSTAFDGNRIFGGDTANGQVFALGRGGSELWQSPDGPGHLSPVAVANHVLYTIDPAGFLVARDPATGVVKTMLPLGGASFGGISASDGAVYVAVGTGPPPAPAPQQDGSGSIVAFGDPSSLGANTFSGSCQLSGHVSFQPALTTSAQPVDQTARGTGTCSGSFTDRQGRTHSLDNAPVSFAATEHGDQSSCGGGTDSGTGTLTFPQGSLRFAISEVRGAAVVLASLSGAHGGSARATVTPSSSENPVAVLQCAGPGLAGADIDISATTSGISG